MLRFPRHLLLEHLPWSLVSLSAHQRVPDPQALGPGPWALRSVRLPPWPVPIGCTCPGLALRDWCSEKPSASLWVGGESARTL